MKPAITRVGWMRILTITIVGIALLPFAPGPRQFWNMHLASAHAEKLRPILQADPRFKHVKLDTYTGGGGSLMLHGEVDSEEDNAELKKLVDTTHPPIKVFFMTITSKELHKWDKPAANPTSTPAAE